MGIKIIDRQYIDAFDPAANVSWLIGNVGDWKRARFLLEAGVEYIATTSQPIAINTEEKTLKLMNGKKWSDYGFDVSEEITINYVKEITDEEGNPTATPVSFTFFATQVYNDTIVYDNNSGFGVIGAEMIPTQQGNFKIYGVKLYRIVTVGGVRVKYNNISNNDVQGHSLNSFIDGSVTEGFAQLTEATTELTLIGNQSGMAVKRMGISPAYGVGSGEAVTANWNIQGATGSMQFNASTINFIDIARAANRTSYSTTAEEMTKNVTTPIIPVTGANYSSGSAGSCFIYNSTIEDLLYFSLNINLTAVNTTNEQDPIYIRLVLIKYKDGAALNFDERIVLDEWLQEKYAENVPLSYNNITPIGVQLGTSFAFAVEFMSGAIGQNITRKLDYKINSGAFSISQNLGGDNYKKNYWLEIDYMLASFFESIDNFEEMQPPETVFDANSLTDIIQVQMFPEWNNPNTSISTNPNETERLGNTGWFNENFNGLPNPFSVKEMGYKDDSDNTLAALSYGQPVKVRAVVTGYTGLLQPGVTSVNYGFMWLPANEEEYKVKTTPFHQNTKVNSPDFTEFVLGSSSGATLVYEGFTATPDERMDVKNISVNQVDNDLVFEATFIPTQGFANFFEGRTEDRKYILWLSVGEGNINTSNRVSLLLDFNDMENFIPISGEWEGVTTRFIEHPEDENYPGVELYEGFLEDDVLAKSSFNIPKNTRLSQIVMGYEVENTETGEAYELERYNANLQPFITTPDGVQQLAFLGQRGYKYVNGNNKNWAKIIRDPNTDTVDEAGYLLYFGQKMRWEYWLQRYNVPSEYYDPTQEYNGSSNDWLNYLRTSEAHRVNFFILFDVIEEGEVVRYKNTFEITFKGYDENTDIITTEHLYSGFNSGADLMAGTDPETGRPLGIIVNNDFTLVRIKYTKVDGSAWDLNNTYAVTTLEIDKGAGQLEHRQLSSIVESEVDNVLISLPGDNGLKLEVFAGQTNVLVTSCLVDYTKLTGATKYKITGRVGCFRNENGVPVIEKVYEDEAYSNDYE